MYSKELFKVMESFLDSIEVDHVFEEDFFRFYATIGDEINICFIVRLEENGYIVSATPVGISVPEEKMTDVLEYINMVNVETIGPSMTMYEDIVMCSYSLYCRGMIPDEEQIRGFFVSIISCIETFGSGVYDIMEGKGTPKEIFKRCVEEAEDNE